MKRFIASTAMALVLTTSAYAANQDPTLETYASSEQSDIYASEFIGMRLYSVEKNFDRFNETYVYADDTETEWDDIGEINDVILGRDGDIKAVILGVGGFLGIGEKDVAVSMNQIKFVQESDDPDDFFLVVNANRDILTDAPAFERKGRIMGHDAADAAEREILQSPTIKRDGYTEVTQEQLTSEKLTGAVVYDINDENIGEIDRLLLTDSGKIDKAVVDVGGFLGMGEKPIAVTMDELSIVQTDGGDDVRVYINVSKEQLEAQPTFEVN